MSTTNGSISPVDQLATRIEQDIRRRNLWAGDRYLTASEAAQMLGVSAATAHRAMQVLVERRMLVRRRNRGTFVGPDFQARPRSQIRTVYALMAAPSLDRDTIPLDAFIHGIRSQVIDANVQIGFLPASDVQAYVQDLVQSAMAAGPVAGFVPVSCPREVYRRLADSGVPTVVFGTPYIDQNDIPSVDVDNFEAGRLLVKHLTDSGHRRMAVFSALEGQPGSNSFYDGVSEALTAAELPHNSLVVRVVPLEPVAMAAQLSEVLAMPDRPTALIARSPTMARLISAAFDRLDVPAAERCEVVYQNHPAVEGQELPLTRVEPRMSFGEIIAQVGQMLQRLGNGLPLEQRRVSIPMDLHVNDAWCRWTSSAGHPERSEGSCPKTTADSSLRSE
jgi:DNA-binding LacI/PurR family transcriptional regulator